MTSAGPAGKGTVDSGLITNLKRASAVPNLPTATEVGYPSLALDP
jgi:tripartite-type tricarboxylate transporter receptor subunit TctC